MEITTTTINRNPSRRAAINTLAVVGFIALIIIGIGLAIYSARYVPIAVSRIGSAAVSLSQTFRPAQKDPELQVVSLASTTLPIEDADTVIATTTTIALDGTSKPAGTQTATGGSSYTVVTTTQTPIAPYGKPDLKVTISAVGYLRSNDTDSFVESRSVPDGKQGAVKFTVRNDGTNVSDKWEFKAEVPTSPSFSYSSPTQRSLNPGDRIDYVLGFDRAREGDDRTITITVDSKHDVSESNEDNNQDSARVDIKD